MQDLVLLTWFHKQMARRLTTRHPELLQELPQLKAEITAEMSLRWHRGEDVDSEEETVAIVG